MGWLTTNSPMSSYGIPVLRLAEDWGDPNRPMDYGPADLVAHGKAAEIFGSKHAAELIKRWVEGQKSILSDDTIDAARSFLSQWPEGPQIK